MAVAKIEPPYELIDQIKKLETSGKKVMNAALRKGGKVLCNEVLTGLNGNIGIDTKYPSRTTGELAAALGITPASLNSKGDYDIKVGFREPRSDGKVNALIANVIEHGRPGKSPSAVYRRNNNGSVIEYKQKGRGIFRNAEKQAKSRALAAMEEEFENQLEDILR